MKTKDKTLGKFVFTRVLFDVASVPLGVKLDVNGTNDVKRALALACKGNTVGYIVGSAAALLKALEAHGISPYGICTETPDPDSLATTVELFYTPRRI